MSILDRFEKKIEGAVNGAFSKIGSKELKPVDYSLALKKELDSKAVVLNQDRTVTPNRFTVKLSTYDFDKIESWGSSVFADELAMELAQYAKSQRYVFVGPVNVVFEENIDFESNYFEVTSESMRGTVQSEENMTSAQGKPVLEINSNKYVLGKEITIIGRDALADIVLDDSGVSRKHLEIRVTPAGTIATDLGSTNGVYVERQKVSAVTLVNGNLITIGRTEIIYRES